MNVKRVVILQGEGDAAVAIFPDGDQTLEMTVARDVTNPKSYWGSGFDPRSIEIQSFGVEGKLGSALDESGKELFTFLAQEQAALPGERAKWTLGVAFTSDLEKIK